MLPRAATSPLFDRLRGLAALRVLLVVAAILASQSSLACAIEEAVFATPVAATDSGPDGTAEPDGGCCALCTDCTHSGGCCSFAATPRAGVEGNTPVPLRDARLSPDAAAPGAWTPPTLLRPPTRNA